MAISFRDVLRQIYGSCGLAVSPGKPRGPILRGAARSRTLQEGPKCVLRVGGEPMKTAGPHDCEERPGAAHSRRDQNVCCG